MNLPPTTDLLRLFGAYLNEAGLSAISIKNYLSDLRHFLAFATHTTTPLANPSLEYIFENLSKYINLYRENQVSNLTPVSSLNRRLASVRRFAAFIKTSFNIFEKPTAQTVSSLSDTAVTDTARTSYSYAPTINEDFQRRLLGEFKLYLEREKKSHSTIKNYLSDVNHFLTWSANDNPLTADKLPSFFSDQQLSAYNTYEKLSQTSTSVIIRRLSSIKKLAQFAHEQKYLSHNPFSKDTTTEVKSPLNWIKRLFVRSHEHDIISNTTAKGEVSGLKFLYSRYASLSFAPYLNLIFLVLAISALSLFGYDQIMRNVYPSSAATPPVVPNRNLSFQGRLTDVGGTPITTAINVTFRLYDALTSGTQLYTTGACSITPNQDGIFNTLLGNGTCGSAIPATVFSNNRDVYVEVQVASETLTPRQQIATVGYALNSDTLQGYPASDAATAYTVPVMDGNGNINLASFAPSIIATGSFTLKGSALNLQTTSAGNIVIQPDTTGNVQMLTAGATGNQFRISNANLSTGTLISGYVGNDTATDNLLSLTSGSSETNRFSVGAKGNTIINTTGGTDSIFSASASGSTKFVITSAGNVGIGTTSPTVPLQVQSTGTNIANYFGSSGNQIVNGIGYTAASGRMLYYGFSDNPDGTSGYGFLTVYGDALGSALNVKKGGNVGIGTTNPGQKLDVSGNATVSGNLTAGGQVQVGRFGSAPTTIGAGSIYYNAGTSKLYYSNGSDWVDMTGGVSSTNFWQYNLGTISPAALSNDVLLGGNSTASAKIAFLNMNGASTPLATMSAGLSGALVFDANGNITTTNKNSLTLGDPTNTGNIILNTAGNVGIGTTSPLAKLDIRAGSGTTSVASVSGATSFASMVVDNSGLGDLFTASTSGTTRFVIDKNGNVGIGVVSPGYKLDVAGTLNLSTGNTYKINGLDVLSATTLGSNVVNSSLTQVGVLASGSIDTGFGTITTANTITGTTLNGTTGLNTGAGSGTQRIDASGNLVNIAAITASGNATISGDLMAGGQLQIGRFDVAPTTIGAGALYYDSGTQKVYYSNGTTWSEMGAGSSGTWQYNAGGTISTSYSTSDVLIGSSATTSAKIAFINVSSGTPTASISGTTTNVATFIDGNGNISTTKRANLILGNSATYNSTGNILLNPNGTGNVGIGVTSPTAKLEVGGNAKVNNLYLASDGIYDSGNTLVIDTSANNSLLGGNWYVGDVTNGIILSPDNTTPANSYITIGNGNGKINVGTVDPPYTINGERYATYLPSMIGVKEEVTGSVTTSDYVEGVGYRTVVDLLTQPKDSDLWVFSKTTALSKSVSGLTVLLTAQGPAKTWYELDATRKLLTVYSSAPTTISYRLTAPRFDANKWATKTPDSQVAGLIVNDPDVNQNGVILPNYSANITKINPDTYTLSTNGQNNLEEGSFFRLLVANFKAGLATVSEIVTDTLVVNDKLISPVAQIDNLQSDTITTNTLTTNDATVSGILFANNLRSATVDTLSGKINLLDDKYSTASAILSELQSKYRSYESLLNATDSSDLLSVTSTVVPSASIPAELTLSTIHASTVMSEDVLINGSLIANSLNSFDQDLYIQPAGQKAINLLAGLMILQPTGQVTINGDLLVTGTLFANAIGTNTATISGQLALGANTATISADKLLAVYSHNGSLISSVDASGSADFQQLATNELVIASNLQNLDSTNSATIGTSIIASDSAEIFVPNLKVDDNTLVYITPVSDTQNQVLFVKSQKSGEGFTVGVASPVVKEIKFNYWLVKTKS